MTTSDRICRSGCGALKGAKPESPAGSLWRAPLCSLHDLSSTQPGVIASAGQASSHQLSTSSLFSEPDFSLLPARNGLSLSRSAQPVGLSVCR